MMSKIYNCPEKWKVLKLEKLLTQDVKNGYSPNCPEESNGSWILGLGNLTDNGFDPSQAKPAPVDDMKVKDFLLKSGDFLISRSNTLDKVGRTMLFRGEIENCSYPDLLMRFRVDEFQVVNEYLECYLKTPIVRKYIQSCASGTSESMVKINKTVVENIPVILPPVPEQRAIADLLSIWDKAIEKTERLVQAKESRFKFLINTLLGDVESWKKHRLGSICAVKKGVQINVSDMSKNGAYYVLNGGIGPSGRTDGWNTEAETITISEGGNSCGYVNYNSERFWSGGHCYSLLGVRREVDKDFLFFYLKRQESELMRLRVGSGLPNIQKKDVENFIVFLPSFNEQSRISHLLLCAQREISLLKQLSEKYKTQKRSLMQKILTGKWRIKPEIVSKNEEV